MAIILNMCISEAIFLDAFKEAIILPLFKKGNVNKILELLASYLCLRKRSG